MLIYLCKFTKTHWVASLKWMDFMVYKLYLNTTVKTNNTASAPWFYSNSSRWTLENCLPWPAIIIPLAPQENQLRTEVLFLMHSKVQNTEEERTGAHSISWWKQTFKECSIQCESWSQLLIMGGHSVILFSCTLPKYAVRTTGGIFNILHQTFCVSFIDPWNDYRKMKHFY